MPRKTLIFPMRMHKEHAFGHLSGYAPAFWMFAQKRGREGNNCFVYLSTRYCHQPGEKCSDGYIYHDGRLEWYFEIDEARSSFGDKDLRGIVGAGLDRFVPPFRRYDDHKYWFLLRNLRRLNRKPEYEAVYENHQKVLDPNRFWYISENGNRKPISSSALRSLEGAPYVGYTTVDLPPADHIDTLYDPYRDLIREAIFRRGGLDEQAIEESFLLVILDEGYEKMIVKRVVQQAGFTNEAAEKDRYDMAFWTEDETCYARVQEGIWRGRTTTTPQLCQIYQGALPGEGKRWPRSSRCMR